MPWDIPHPTSGCNSELGEVILANTASVGYAGTLSSLLLYRNLPSNYILQTVPQQGHEL